MLTGSKPPYSMKYLISNNLPIHLDITFIFCAPRRDCWCSQRIIRYSVPSVSSRGQGSYDVGEYWKSWDHMYQKAGEISSEVTSEIRVSLKYKTGRQTQALVSAHLGPEQANIRFTSSGTKSSQHFWKICLRADNAIQWTSLVQSSTDSNNLNSSEEAARQVALSRKHQFRFGVTLFRIHSAGSCKPPMHEAVVLRKSR